MKIHKNLIFLISTVVFVGVLLTGCKISIDVGFSNKIIEPQTIQENNEDTFQFDINKIEKALDGFTDKLKNIEDKAEINEALAMFKNDSNLEELCVYFADATGKIYIDPVVELPEDYDARTRIWYKQAIKEKIYISEPYVDPGTDTQTITIARKVIIDGEIIGVVGVDATILSN